MTRNPLIWAGTLLLIVLAIGAAIVANALADALHAWEQAPARLQASIDALPGQVLPPVLASVDAAVSDADARVKQIAESADVRLSDALRTINDVAAKADARTGEALGEIRLLRMAATPVLANSAALVKDAQDSLDDSYWDVKALIGSATVATTQTAQAAEAVRSSLPQFLATSQATNRSLAGVTADIHDMTTEIDRRFFHPPARTWRQKIGAALKDTVFVGAGVARIAR